MRAPSTVHSGELRKNYTGSENCCTNCPASLDADVTQHEFVRPRASMPSNTSRARWRACRAVHAARQLRAADRAMRLQQLEHSEHAGGGVAA